MAHTSLVRRFVLEERLRQEEQIEAERLENLEVIEKAASRSMSTKSVPNVGAWGFPSVQTWFPRKFLETTTRMLVIASGEVLVVSLIASGACSSQPVERFGLKFPPLLPKLA